MGIPEIELNSGYKMSVLGLGTASDAAFDDEVQALVNAIERGYRLFDTAALYQSEKTIGEAVAEALNRGLIKSRDELFIVSKLWVNDAHAHRVLPALHKTLQNLKLQYLDLYLIHWPVSVMQEKIEYPVSNKKDIVPFDYKGVWTKMEEAVKSGLVKSIGACNFTCKKIDDLLSVATIPPAVIQVEVSPLWQQKKLIDFCKSKGIVVDGYSTLGSAGYIQRPEVLGAEALREIAKAKEKSVPQVIFRWAHQLGVVPIVKSYNPGRMEENRNIFDWELSDQEMERISEINPQSRGWLADGYVGEESAIKSLEDLWDGEL